MLGNQNGAVEHRAAKAELHEHQQHGKPDAADSQQQSLAIVNQVVPCQRRFHREPYANNSAGSARLTFDKAAKPEMQHIATLSTSVTHGNTIPISIQSCA